MKFKILGIEYDLSKSDITKENYEVKLQSIEKLLSTWSWRFLTIFGKMIIIKTLAIPLLIHLFRALPNPPANFFKRLNSTFYNFIWNNKPDKIKRSIIISNFEEGGLKMIHIESFSKSLKMYWIQKLLDDSITSEWKTLLVERLINYGGNNILSYHPDSIKNISKNFNPFWKNIFEIWCEQYSEIQNPRCQPLWFNPKIKIGGEVIFYKHWYNAGINNVNDLLDEQGHFFKHRDFIQKYNLNENFLRFSSVISAVPREWKQEIRTDNEKLDLVEYDNIKAVKKNKNINKYIYQNMLAKIKDTHTELETKWKVILNNENIELTEHFTLLHKYIKGTTLKNLQYKILHRIYPTNKSLYKMKIINYNRCSICQTVESLEHLLFECIVVKNLWYKIFEELDLGHKFQNFEFTRATVTLGYVNHDNIYISGINTFIVLIKQYILNCKNNNKKISFLAAKNFLIYHSRIQKSVFRNMNMEWAFLEEWLN